MAPRPTLPDDQRRDVALKVRFTRDEYKQLKAKAHAAGYTPGAYVHQLVVHGQPTPPPRPRRAEDQLLYELNRMANNMRQLHEATGLQTYDEWARYLGERFPREILARHGLANAIEDILPALNDAGQHLNRLAHRANAGRPPGPEDLSEATTAIRDALKPLRDAAREAPLRSDPEAARAAGPPMSDA